MAKSQTTTAAAKPASSSCQIQQGSTPQRFAAKLANSPFKIRLCEDSTGKPAVSSSFNSATVTAFGSPAALPNIVSNLANTTLTLTFQQAGVYDVGMQLNSLPGCQRAVLFEDCVSTTLPLDEVAPATWPYTYFVLEVN
jgi:hypothetical protein